LAASFTVDVNSIVFSFRLVVPNRDGSLLIFSLALPSAEMPIQAFCTNPHSDLAAAVFVIYPPLSILLLITIFTTVRLCWRVGSGRPTLDPMFSKGTIAIATTTVALYIALTIEDILVKEGLARLS
jgi:hypothetical protein